MLATRNSASILISIALILTFLLICAPASAVIVEVNNGSLLDSQDEGVSVQYTIEISGIPKQARILEMSTDLISVSDTNLWVIDTGKINVSGGDASLNDQEIKLTSDDGEFLGAVTVTVTGRAPVLTSSEVVDGVVVTKRNTQTTGYSYYNVKALDENGDILGTAATETFSVTIPGEKEFDSRLNDVSDTKLRSIISDFYSKGLTEEAGELLDYAEASESENMPFTTALIIGVVLFVVGLAAGIIFGQIRARNMMDFQDEYKGD
ncbi:hypothetical protein J2128_001365 [Methanomicrobium sp. W14]|uniref:hypothetical protein n=1 Tax=Methanomicrobium sp. W14 TaxID=2817839 RepID=UPI001AE849DF|nr:hypothetical protein [Methanomicrobium sp. W14]MBP2133411.1 hypothetical protein [Methanomicrobium sp. W14]